MKDFKVALKIGASSTQLIVSQLGYVLSEPSFVYANNETCIGEKAKQMLSQFEQVITPINNGEIVNPDAFVLLIKAMLNKCNINGNIGNFYVAVPNGIKIATLQTIEQCLLQCGAIKVNFVNQNNIAYNVLNTNNTARLIVNMGASGTDITIVKNNKVVDGLNLNIGGNNLDKAIIEFCADAFSIDITPDMAEKIRINACTLLPTINLSYSFYGLSVNGNKFAKNNITSYDLYNIVQEYYANICTAVETLLNVSSENDVKEIIENGVDLIGGCSLISGLKEFVDLKLNININTYKNATEIVALGLEKLV